MKPGELLRESRNARLGAEVRWLGATSINLEAKSGQDMPAWQCTVTVDQAFYMFKLSPS